MSIGLAIIALNEEQNLPHLLESVDKAFDRVVLLDTGSTDDTKQIFASWAKNQTGMTYSIGDFEWIGDFAAARNAADELLLYGHGIHSGVEPLVDWTCWADCDDTIIGAENLRSVVQSVAPQLQALIFTYDYIQHPETGQSICQLARERLVRAGAGVWTGRVHEGQTFPNPGPMTHVPADICHWKHHKVARAIDGQVQPDSNARNLALLEEWAVDEPENPRVLAYLGKERGVAHGPEAAIEAFEHYAAIDPPWDDERAQVHRLWAMQLHTVERPADAELLALAALQHRPTWTDTYLTMAECAAVRYAWQDVLHWCKLIEAIGPPHTPLIVNPLDYTALPARMRAIALANLGDLAGAEKAADTALEMYPGDQELRGMWTQWRSINKRERTADTFAMMAEQAISHDEQLKARTILEAVPYFAQDHPRIVGMRAQLARRLAWVDDLEEMREHYEVGGSKPEDFHDDEQSDVIAQQLPRVGYLLDGLRDQAAAA